jgi:hypothetical protein
VSDNTSSTTNMPPKKQSAGSADDFNLAVELVKALQDEAVIATIGALFDVRVCELLDSVSEVKSENALFKLNLIEANQKIDRLEAYSRRENLVITGLPVVSYSEAANSGDTDTTTSSLDTEMAVIELCREKLKLSVTSNDISIAHRLLKKNKGSKNSPVIVRFTSRKVRDTVFRARRQLKELKSNDEVTQKIFINEDLTKQTSEIFYYARDLVKKKKLYSTWTNGGVVMIKETNDPNCKPVKVLAITDLPS